MLSAFQSLRERHLPLPRVVQFTKTIHVFAQEEMGKSSVVLGLTISDAKSDFRMLNTQQLRMVESGIHQHSGVELTMGSAREKGKIPHEEWPKILTRYERGETIAKISRDYACTAPAIRYIIKRKGSLKSRTERRVGQERRTAPDAVGRQAGASVASDVGTVGRGSGVGGRVLGADLRRRVSGDVASFLVALDQTDIEGSRESVSELQEATDRLMRSIARTRLELERLLAGRETARVGRLSERADAARA